MINRIILKNKRYFFIIIPFLLTLYFIYETFFTSTIKLTYDYSSIFAKRRDEPYGITPEKELKNALQGSFRNTIIVSHDSTLGVTFPNLFRLDNTTYPIALGLRNQFSEINLKITYESLKDLNQIPSYIIKTKIIPCDNTELKIEQPLENLPNLEKENNFEYENNSLLKNDNRYYLYLNNKKYLLYDWLDQYKLNQKTVTLVDYKTLKKIPNGKTLLPGKIVSGMIFYNKNSEYFYKSDNYLYPISNNLSINFKKDDYPFVDLEIIDKVFFKKGNDLEYNVSFNIEKDFNPNYYLYLNIPNTAKGNFHLKKIVFDLKKRSISLKGNTLKEKISNFLRIYCSDC